MKPINVKYDSYAKYNVNYNDKDPKFKQAIMLEFPSIKTFLLMDMLLVGQKKFLL